MKIEPKFLAKENKLFFLDGTEFPLADKIVLEENFGGMKDADELQVFALKVKWSQIGFDEENYNEEFLALLREDLKSVEEKNAFAFIVPVADKKISSEQEKENFVASVKHCARRIKDCTNVIGFEIPSEADADFFVSELSQKHPHYIFFSRDKNLLSVRENVVESD